MTKRTKQKKVSSKKPTIHKNTFTISRVSPWFALVVALVVIAGLFLSFGSGNKAKAGPPYSLSCPAATTNITTNTIWTYSADPDNPAGYASLYPGYTVATNAYDQGAGDTTQIKCRTIQVYNGTTLVVIPRSSSAKDFVIEGNLLVGSSGSGAGTLILEGGGKTTASSGFGMEVSATGNVDIKTNGTINAVGKGYAAGFGPGFPSADIANQKAGAGHGGEGGIGGVTRGAIYDSSSDPSELGSGAFGDYGGGGLIKIISQGNVLINGTVNANGSGTSANVGTSSGGSINVVAGNIGGSGSISADGASAATGYGGGAGGRIALIYQTSNSFSGSASAKGGDSHPSVKTYGGAGTIYKAKTSAIPSGTLSEKELIVSNNSSFDAGAGYVNYDSNISKTKIDVAGITPNDIYKSVKISKRSNVYVASGETVILDGSGGPATFEVDDSKIENQGTIQDAGGQTDTFLFKNKTRFFNPGSLDIETDIGSVPGNTANVVFDGVDTYFENQNTTIQNMGNLAIQNHTSLTHKSNTGIACRGVTGLGGNCGTEGSFLKNYTLEIFSGNVNIDSTSRIDVSQKGYDPTYGPGANPVTATEIGAGYGGAGSRYGASSGGQSYGSASNPQDLGSGASGGSGGGLISINVIGTFTNNGTISSDGFNSSNTLAGSSGGGIKVVADTISGAGSISANGGEFYISGAPNGWGPGGGGRIALIYKTAQNFYGPMGARGGIRFNSSALQNGGAGTIFFAKTDTIPPGTLSKKELVISNGSGFDNNSFVYDSIATTKIEADTYTNITIKNRSNAIISSGTVSIGGADSSNRTFEVNDSRLENNGAISSSATGKASEIFTAKNGARFINTGNIGFTSASSMIFDGTNTYFENQNLNTLNMANLFVQNSALLTHKSNSDILCRGITVSGGNCGNEGSFLRNYILEISATNVVVGSTGQINVAGKGYPGSAGSSIIGYGPGVNLSSTAPWSEGASYGGRGGNYSTGVSGPTYGSDSDPKDLGSGSYYDFGGGVVRITAASGTIANYGSIDAGSFGGGSYCDNGSCASGGSIKLQATNIVGNGSVSTKGGSYSNAYAGGGGGRLAIIATNLNLLRDSAHLSVLGGASWSGGKAGQNGTIYVNGTTNGPTLPRPTDSNPIVFDYTGLPANNINYLSTSAATINSYYVDEGNPSPAYNVILTINAYNSSGVLDGSFTNVGAGNALTLGFTNSIGTNPNNELEITGCRRVSDNLACWSGGNPFNSYAVPINSSTNLFSGGSATIALSIRDKRTSGIKHHTFTGFSLATGRSGYTLATDGYSGAMEIEDGTPTDALTGGQLALAGSLPHALYFDVGAFSSGASQYQQDLSGVVGVRRVTPGPSFGSATLSNRKSIYKVGDYIDPANGNISTTATDYIVACVTKVAYAAGTFRCSDSGLASGTTYSYGFYSFDNTHGFYTQNEAANYSAATTISAITGAPTPNPITSFNATGDLSKIALAWNNPVSNVGMSKTIIVRRTCSSQANCGSEQPNWVPAVSNPSSTDYNVGDPTGQPGEVIIYADSINTTAGQALSFDDVGVADGTWYHYKIYTQYADYFNGVYSYYYSLSSPPHDYDTPFVPTVPPTSLTATAQGMRIALAWTAPVGGSPDKYVIVRKQGSGPLFVPTNGANYVRGSATGQAGEVIVYGDVTDTATSFNDDLVDNLKYYYKIYAHYAGDLYSSSTEGLAPNNITANATAIAPAPQNPSADGSIPAANFNVGVSWSAPVPANSFLKYVVSRKQVLAGASCAMTWAPTNNTDYTVTGSTNNPVVAGEDIVFIGAGASFVDAVNDPGGMVNKYCYKIFAQYDGETGGAPDPHLIYSSFVSTSATPPNRSPDVVINSAVQTLGSDDVVVNFTITDPDIQPLDIVFTMVNPPSGCLVTTVSGSLTGLANGTYSRTWTAATTNGTAGDCSNQELGLGEAVIKATVNDPNDASDTDSEGFLLDTLAPIPPTTASDFNLLETSKTDTSITIHTGPNPATDLDLKSGANDAFKIFYASGASVTESDNLVSAFDVYASGQDFLIATLAPSAQYSFNIWAYDNYGHKTNATLFSDTTNGANSAPSVAFVTQPVQTLGTNNIPFSFHVSDPDSDNLSVSLSLINNPGGCSISTGDMSGFNSTITGVTPVFGPDQSMTWTASGALSCPNNEILIGSNLEIQVSVDDGHAHIASATSSPFLLDTKVPVAPDNLALVLGPSTAEDINVTTGLSAGSDTNPLATNAWRVFKTQGSSVPDPTLATTPWQQSDAYTPSQTYNDIGLIPGTQYSYNICLFDKYGHHTCATNQSLTTAAATLSLSVTGFGIGQSVGGETTNIDTTGGAFSLGSIELPDSKVGAFELMGSSNTTNGYTVMVRQDHDLASSNGTIPGLSFTNAAPDFWPGGDVSFLGYSTTSPALPQFNTIPRKWAGFTAIDQNVSQRTSPGSSTEDFLIKLTTSSTQSPGSYLNNITLSIFANL